MEKKRKNLAVLAKTPRLKRFFSATLLSSKVKTVALTRAPENCRWKSRHKFRSIFYTQPDWPYWHVDFPVFLFVISGSWFLFGWMWFLAVTLSSLWKYFFLARYTVALISLTLFSQLIVCAVEHHIYSIVSRGLYSFFMVSCGLQSMAAYIVYFFTLPKDTDDAHSFLGYVFSTKFFFRILFFSTSRAHPSQEGLW